MTPSELDRSVELRDLLARLRPRLMALLRSYRITEDQAEQVLHDTLLAFAVRRQRIGNPDAWFLATVEARCVTLGGRRGRREAPREAAPLESTGEG